MEIVIPAPQRLTAYNTVFDARELRGVSDTKWQQFGVQFSAAGCGAPLIVSVDRSCDPIVLPVSLNPTPIVGAIDAPLSFDTQKFYPFEIEWAASCSPTQIMNSQANLDEFVSSFKNVFEVAAHRSVAHALWTGVPSTTTYPVQGLADVPALNQLPNSLGIVAAFGQLSQALAQTGAGSQGVFHMTPYVANAAVSKQLVYRSGSQLRTVVGDHLVIADGGYTGSQPNDIVTAQASDVQWIYATGQVYYMKSAPVSLSSTVESFNRRANMQVVDLKSSVIFMWEQCQWFGVPLNVNCDAGC